MSADHNASSSGSLRIAVIGLGGIGSAFAFQLARTGHHDVTAIARPDSARLRQLRRDKGIVNTENERADMHVADALDEDIPFDLVLVTLLAHQVETVIPQLQRSAAKSIHFMFNNFDPERLRNIIGAERCSFGMPFVQATVDKDGRLKATIGAGGQKTKMDHERWVQVFNSAGLPAVLEPKMLLWLRCHAPLCVAFESISFAGVQRGRGASWGEAMAVARGVKECFTLIKRLGYQLYPSGKSFLSASPAWVTASMLWFSSRLTTFRSLLATGVGECRALVDVMVADAAKADRPVSLMKIRAMKPKS